MAQWEVHTLGPEVQLALLVLSVLVVYAICRALAQAILYLLRVTSPFWGALLPWALFQAYLAVGLFIWGGLPAPPGGFFGVVGISGLASVGLALFRRRREMWRVAALMVGWAVVWTCALVWSAL